MSAQSFKFHYSFLAFFKGSVVFVEAQRGMVYRIQKGFY